jgi:hypothetical protein|eukprot:CAMPEP_0174300354 /NCGR_PEP_ID=MMETSP0809-20121228/58418_1 /TAXON_ID=73025 ORGANISM="Eutreptiella gymnastica-like, Strain CCMP1594" /NCGR_SAMPLE_ID=MMETSP0809 /ASSEMBLY_ACC=CAM_ASM_000658 /LENGTH=89 /DNA_ID=CAMNT_0015405925 /DNA_START=1824 /DNA_END=2093 /DNA_ORIENTATION=+
MCAGVSLFEVTWNHPSCTDILGLRAQPLLGEGPAGLTRKTHVQGEVGRPISPSAESESPVRRAWLLSGGAAVCVHRGISVVGPALLGAR